jgi:hypothetical protein
LRFAAGLTKPCSKAHNANKRNSGAVICGLPFNHHWSAARILNLDLMHARAWRTDTWAADDVPHIANRNLLPCASLATPHPPAVWLASPGAPPYPPPGRTADGANWNKQLRLPGALSTVVVEDVAWRLPFADVKDFFATRG